MTHLDELVQRLRDRDELAWREYMVDYGRLIYLAATRLSLSEADREDVFQNTCVAVDRSIGALRDPARLGSWTYSIARRFALEIVKRRGRQELSTDALEEWGRAPDVAVDPEVEETLSRFEEARWVRGLVDDLGHRCRELVSALYLEDPTPSYEEIGQRLGMPIGSIGPTRARCLRKLRDLAESVSNEGRGPSNG
jgi:RNA polymerase sigma factor (sigma-70 family)